MPEYRVRIKDLPSQMRPRERLLRHGPESLSDPELLAIILRVGSEKESAVALASRLLAKFKGLGGLARATFGELCAEHGVGVAKAAQVKAALELGKRLMASSPTERPVVRSPQDVARLLGEMALLEQEHLRVLLLNTRNHVLRAPEIYKGTVNSASVRVAEVFREAVREGCPAIVVVHNHPSGDPEPSAEDVAVTRQLVMAGQLLGIEVLDHVVLARGGYVSLRERGLGFDG
ncbi:MAG: DNA repair protein RadC [Dehalococcoidia bacterium]|jgi:DNA repair protein RadC|nr:DNA repair protein RadC [Dehalococcoidia bacterium]